MEKHTQALRGQHNTHNHCVTELWHYCQGPVLIRVSPYMKQHTESLREQTKTTADETTVWVNSSVKNLLENNFQGPHVYQGFPPIEQHT